MMDCCGDGRAHESTGFVGDGEFIYFFREYQLLMDPSPWIQLPVWATARNVLSKNVFFNFTYHPFYFISALFVSILTGEAKYSYNDTGFWKQNNRQLNYK